MKEFFVRQMVEDDEAFILELSVRFAEVKMMKWRDPKRIKESILEIAKEAVSGINPDSDVFVAEDLSKQRLGFLHMIKQVDYFTGEEQAYVSLIAVSKEAKGKGIGRLLMNKAEKWAMSKGYKRLTLNVFSQNKGAINLYSSFGYEGEIIKMVKDLE